MSVQETKVTITGCPCGCGRPLCPRCYGHYTNLIDGMLSMFMGMVMCHDCQMSYHLYEMNEMIEGRYNGQMKLDGKAVEKRAENRERLRPLGFQFDAKQEGQEAEGVGLS